MYKVYLSIGTNLGYRFLNIQKCVKLIKDNPRIYILKKSKIYETMPMYNIEQNKFLNLVVGIRTNIQPLSLLSELKKIECAIGRKISKSRNQPRLIDIDILNYGNMVVNSKELIIPHPKITERLFVLKPWSDIDPDYKLPVINKNISNLVSDLDIKSNIIKLYNKSL